MIAEVIALAVRFWHHKSLQWLLPIASIVGVVLIVTASGGDWTEGRHLVTSLAIAALTAATWHLQHRIPRTTKGKIGIIVAIAGETEEHDNQVRSDLIGSLQALVQADAHSTRLEIIVYPRHLAQECHDAFTATRLLSKSRAIFMVWGSVKRREIAGRPSHYIALEGLVRHAAAPVQTSRQIAKDFTVSLPRRGHFPTNDDIFAFELTSETVDLAARFVIGLAALVSGDYPYAELMLRSAEKKVLAATRLTEQHKEIARMLPDRFEALYVNWLRRVSGRLDSDNTAEHLGYVEAVADRLLARNPLNTFGIQVKAICCFELRRDTMEAKRILLQCKHVPDPTWRYSLAFLEAYDGRMQEAAREYKRAFRKQLGDPSVPLQCELFMQRVLTAEPERIQLHFCMGLINEFAKLDPIAALREYREFSSSPLSKRFSAELVAAQASIVRLEGRSLDDEKGGLASA